MLLLVFTTTTGVDDDNCRHSTTTTTMDAAVAQSMTMKTLMLLIYNLEHCLTGHRTPDVRDDDAVKVS